MKNSGPALLDHAIVHTLLYGDVFNFPMTAAEIHHFLIETPARLPEVEAVLEAPSAWLAGHIVSSKVRGQMMYAIVGRGETLFAQRHEREAVSARLWSKGYRYGVWLGHLPFVEMVAVTGALAMRNANGVNDDLDYLLVVRDGRVWLARLFAVMLVRLCRLWGVTICPNYVLSAAVLEQGQQDLFTAHEVAQMVPVMGHTMYKQMRQVNEWIYAFLPNAEGAFYQARDATPRRAGKWLKRLGEWVLSGRLGNCLEHWEMRRKLKKFQRQAAQSVEAHLDEKHVKGHFLDYGQITLKRFQERLEAFNLGREVAVDKQGHAAD